MCEGYGGFPPFARKNAALSFAIAPVAMDEPRLVSNIEAGLDARNVELVRLFDCRIVRVALQLDRIKHIGSMVPRVQREPFMVNSMTFDL